MSEGTRGPGIADPKPKALDEFNAEMFERLAPPRAALLRLDVACGDRKPQGFMGIDCAAGPNVDIVHDLFHFPWPVSDDTVGEVHCSHFLEHIPHDELPEVDLTTGALRAPRRWIEDLTRWGPPVRDLWFRFWEELHRICVDGALVGVQVPYYSSVRADQDPTHRRRMCEASFIYLSQEWLEREKIFYPFDGNFDVVRQQQQLNPEHRGRADEAIVWMATHDLNVVDDLTVTLRVKKPGGAWWKKPKAKKEDGDGGAALRAS